jgi:hypothetical protein
MKIGTAGAIAALGLFVADARADQDPAGSCVSACVQDCLATSTTLETARKCGNTCETSCKHEISAPQHLFVNGVISTPLVCQDPQIPSCGYFVSGKVVSPEFCPGAVTFYQVCPAGDGPATVSVIGVLSVGADCSFGGDLPPGPGDNGCYGLIAVTPATTNPAAQDPGWNTCTSDACPSPRPQ